MNADSMRKSVLIVEDDEQSMRYLEVLLSSEYTVHTASWAQAAWEILNTEAIDIILMDISLPGEENGLQLTRRIRASEAFRQIPIIAVTAHAFPRDRENSLAAGCNDYVSKPFDRKQLLAAVHEWLHK